MNLAKRLTSNYKRDPTSNIGRLMMVIELELQEIRDTIKMIELYRLIDNATGVTLDNIGKNVLQERGAMDDVRYRMFLKVKIRANRSSGQIDTINEIMDVLLDDHFLGVREVWNDPSYGNEPAALEVRYLNYFDKIKGQYQNLEDDPWYLDGKYKLDGSRKLDGGFTFSYEDYEDKILEAMTQVKQMANFIKTGGVKVWWCEPVSIASRIDIENTVTTNMKIKTETAAEINHMTANKIDQTVENIPAFLLDGINRLDGMHYLDGNREIVEHDVTITQYNELEQVVAESDFFQ
ncbi:hypothetical protein [Acetobacterium wieringae]|uniref:hypothetical protein n=1 Tax=Acetobacterium wieringae TaxID=52694 RepID=UPI002B20649E|nr:hypothetical protein [Acetobacterium wieringae]MEA4805075.1 hypothetical protein [Acetobacterium wieringae]